MFQLRKEKGLDLIILILTEILIAYIIIVYLNLFSIDYDLYGVEVIYTFKANIIPLLIFGGIISFFKEVTVDGPIFNVYFYIINIF